MRLHVTTLKFGLFIAGLASLAMVAPDFLMAQGGPPLPLQTRTVTSDVLNLPLIGNNVLDFIAPETNAFANQQRSGGRGAPANPAAPAQGQQPAIRGGARQGPQPITVQPIGVSASQPGPAWWTNAALVARLGLTDDQKKKIEATFEQHRQVLVQNTRELERQEAMLARMLEAEPMEAPRLVSAQIEQVIQARGEMERTNSKMTLEIRQNLTRSQWVQLQAETLQPAPPLLIAPGGRGQRSGGPAAPIVAPESPGPR